MSSHANVTPVGRLWLVFFAYAAGVAAFVQLILLPFIFPAWHSGHGLLAGGDWPWFHQIAAELAEKIQVQGWSAWLARWKSAATV
jgi:hypothetical protein